MDIVILRQHRQDVPLGVIGCPLPNALGSRRGGEPGFKSSTEFQRMDGMDTTVQRFIGAAAK
jgi:hypothetical protein